MYVCVQHLFAIKKNVISDSMEAVPTFVVEDSQPEMVQPDNQEGLTQATQLQPPESSDSQGPQALAENQPPQASDSAEVHRSAKDGHEVTADLAKQAELLTMPQTQAYADGSQGPKPVEAQSEKLEPSESQAEEKPEPSEEKGNDDQMAATEKTPEEKGNGEVRLVRKGAFDDDDLDEFTCKKCKVIYPMDQGVARGPFEVWCRECNSLYTVLRRHLQWPPPSFVELTDEQQAAFWTKCNEVES